MILFTAGHRVMDTMLHVQILSLTCEKSLVSRKACDGSLPSFILLLKLCHLPPRPGET